MPLDADAAADSLGPAAAEAPDLAQGEARRIGGLPRPAKVVLAADGDVGQALKAARESLGLAVDDIAQATRVGAAHIAAIEAFDLAALPSRPFTVGFVRAYARCLGLDTEAVVDRFRVEAPSHDQDLRPPLALHLYARRRFGWLMVLVAVVVGAVIAWNVSRHALDLRHGGPPKFGPVPAGAGPPVMSPARQGAPPPAPPEAAAPPTYVTPGLAPSESEGASGTATGGSADTGSDADTKGRPFVPAGAVYGGGGRSGVLLQAIKPTTLVVRGTGGAVYFARQLATGEAWRAPPVAGLSVDVGNPAAVEVFYAGVSRGPLAQAQTRLADLTPTAP